MAAEIHPSAVVHPGVKLGKGVVVGPFCVVGEHVEIGGPRVEGANIRGTGCMYASALAACLGLGLNVRAAAREAKAFVTAAIRGSAAVPGADWKIGAIPRVWEVRKN